MPFLSTRGRPARTALLLALVGLATALLYAPNLNHEFVLDSVASVERNPALTSLANWQRLLGDPTALTVIRGNLDVRPVLMLVNALNYQLSGTSMWGWHAVQVLAHLACGLGLFSLTRRLGRDIAGLDENDATLAGLLVAAVVLLHPTGAGVVNYVHARSSLLVAALLLPAMSSFARWCAIGAHRSLALSAVLFALALFTKVEALAALGVFMGIYLLYARADTHTTFQLLHRLLDRRLLLAMLPFMLIGAANLVCRELLLPDFHAAARNEAGMSGLDYLRTQLIAWWFYIGKWIWPVNLIADDLSWTIQTAWSAPVLVALTGWLGALTLCIVAWRRWPLLVFGVAGYLIMLSPHSSILPLTEMVNEHRPYLPRMLLTVPLGIWLAPQVSAPTRNGFTSLTWVVVLVTLATLATATWWRNAAYSTRMAYYSDIVAKAPSARAHLNLGLELERVGQATLAVEHYQQALTRAPAWHAPYLNIARLLSARGEDEAALSFFSGAVARERWSTTALLERGLHQLANGRHAAAEPDLIASLDGLLYPDAAYRGLIQARLAQGDVAGALAHTEALTRAAPDRAEALMREQVDTWSRFPQALRALRVYLAGLQARYPGWTWLAPVVRRASQDAAGTDPPAAGT